MAHHVRLGAVPGERRMGEERRRARGDTGGRRIIRALRAVLDAERREHRLEHLGEVLLGDCFRNGHQEAFFRGALDVEAREDCGALVASKVHEDVGRDVRKPARRRLGGQERVQLFHAADGIARFRVAQNGACRDVILLFTED